LQVLDKYNCTLSFYNIKNNFFTCEIAILVEIFVFE